MLQIFISWNIRIKGATTPLKAAITKALTYENPAYAAAKKRRRRVWGVDPKIELYLYDRGDLICPRGFEKELNDILINHNQDPEKVIVRNTQKGREVDFGPWNDSFKVRDYQAPFVESLLKGSGVGIAPAGSGKTIMGMRTIFEYGRSTLWLTHTKDLMYQTAKKAELTLRGVGRIGFFGDGKHEWGDGKLIIATVQTLGANPHLVAALNDFIGMVIIDEAHHFPAVQFIETVGKFKADKLIGVTATPERKDGLHFYLYQGVGPELHRVDRSTLYTHGELIKPDVKFVFTDFDYETASLRNENNSVDAGGEDLDYTDLIRHLIEDEGRLELVAKSILDNAANNHSIVITESVRYCYMIKEKIEQLTASGSCPTMAVVHGGISRYKWVANPPPAHLILEEKATKTGFKFKVEAYTEDEFKNWQVSSKERKEILEACSKKKIDILFATQLAREGLDMPHLTIGHMVMPKRGDKRGDASGSAVEQEIGRIMRPDLSNPDKQATWFDYVDYKVGVFKDQYYSRRRVYTRLGLKVPKKPRTEQQLIEDFLGSSAIFDLPI
ncbi:DEAD/DEAH box helicase [Bacillus velezensis]|uniref:DEAD/DEAH box helicase n=1 Tax=Bacillus TaxID=1386 RepID=UPI001C52DBCF|nr:MULTISPECIES: DEAD/DEAH box helicase [Bacillus amyloliquefaciens group]QXP99297.1 DEAD/DEAH box helicase [Bacillus velezensis]UHH01363.1 DEAD/DEAH box helicase [Bacillus amyloliquefaciens]ULR21110.1 DEAD/DEAH box helicase [Bacillus velezensis]UVW07853.1 DEAD/DEAH box helicase [Bacillus velezensis]WHL75160.1 DEAD/DEAH box helicase [Bacillus velezensis]